MEWRPIETAPRDGRQILIAHTKTRPVLMLVVDYDEDEEHPDHVWHTLDGPAYHRNFPTHWMPLPEPPSC